MGVADNERDAGKCGKLFRSALSITAGDENFRRGILRVDFANGVTGLSIGGGSNSASVDDDEFGVPGRGRGRAAAVEELTLDGGAVGLRGAAAKLLDVEGGHRQE